MKKHFLLFSTVFIASIFLLSSCQEDDNLPVIKTKTQLITQGAWSFDKAFQGTTDISAQVPICYKDNVVSFTSSTNGTVLNPVPCTPPPDNTPTSFTWTFQSGETVLNLSAALFPGGQNNFNIVTLNETSLVISQDVMIAPPTSTNVIFHYKH